MGYDLRNRQKANRFTNSEEGSHPGSLVRAGRGRAGPGKGAGHRRVHHRHDALRRLLNDTAWSEGLGTDPIPSLTEV